MPTFDDDLDTPIPYTLTDAPCAQPWFYAGSGAPDDGGDHSHVVRTEDGGADICRCADCLAFERALRTCGCGGAR